MSEVYQQLPLTIANKRCSKCGQSLPRSDYAPSRQTKDGLYPQCRPCKRGRYWAKRDEALAKAKARYWRDPEAHLDRVHCARRDHPERYRQYGAKSRQRPGERQKEAARHVTWKRANPDYRAKYRPVETRYRLANRANLAAYQANYRARKEGNGGTFTGAEWEALKRSTGHRCLRCVRSEPAIVLEADHVIPVSKGGSNDIGNIQPLCRSCNATKNDRDWDYRL